MRRYSNQSGGPSSISGLGRRTSSSAMPIARRRLLQRVAAPFEVAAHRLVALVHPGGKARDPGRRVGSLHRVKGIGALGGGEVTLGERVVRVVVDGALGLVGEDGGGGAPGSAAPPHRSPRRRTAPRRRAASR